MEAFGKRPDRHGSTLAGARDDNAPVPPDVEPPREWEADVLLRDGRPVHLRPITPADGEALRRFHRQLSPQTVYFRFFAPKPELTDADVERFTHVDHVQRVALVVVDHGELGGVGRFDALGDGSAEVAFVIRDDLQGLGLGSILLEHLAAAGREVGVERFVAEVLPANGRMLATFREAGYSVSQHHEQDVLAVSFAIESTDASRAVREAREHRAESRSVQRLLRPAGVAVVGEPGPLAAVAVAVARHVVAGGYSGPITVVGVDAPAGAESAATLADAPESTELAFVAVAPDRLPAVVDEAGARGLRGVVVVSASADPGDARWATRQAELVERARATGLRIVGPNALGLVNTDPGVRLNASLLPALPRPGRIGLFCQSGAVGRTLMDRLAARRLGVSTFVSAGDRADVSGNDLLQYWADDTLTDVVLLYLESIGNARKFARLVHAVARIKPVVMVRAGGAEQRHPLGHAVARTALPAKAADQVLADCGLVVVDRIADLLDVAAIAAQQPLPGALPPVVVANSDALATLARNALAASGLDATRPPVLLPRSATAAQISAAVTAAADDAGLVLVVHVPGAEATGAETAGPWPVVADVPVVAVLPGVPGPRPGPEGVPVFQDIEDAVLSLAHLSRLSAWRQAQALRVPLPPTALEPLALPAGRHDGVDGADLLADGGLTPRLRVAPAEAALAWRVRVTTDPLYGPVVCVGVDDPVAEQLGDRSWRLAPVSAAAAVEMLGALGARSTVLPDPVDDDVVAAAADLVAAVSRWYLDAPGLTGVDLRDVRVRDGEAQVSAVTILVEDEATVAEPDVRRLREVPVTERRVRPGGTMPA